MSEAETVDGPVTKPRRWWAAFLLMLLGGAGYLYVGRPARYVVYLIVSVLFLVALYHGLWGWLSDPVVTMSLLVVVLLANVGFWIDGIRLAVGHSGYVLRWFNRWWVYVGCLLVSAILSFVPDLIWGLNARAVRVYSIPSVSMSPALMLGDRITADPRAYTDTDPALGDVVIFRLPNQPSIDFVKRVVGLPGDKVQMADGVLLINGVAVPRKKLADVTLPQGQSVAQFKETLPNGRSHVTWDTGLGPADNTHEFSVPEGHYFVLGDNRDNSSDSRFASAVGFVPRENIYAHVGGVIWSKDWSRMGLRVK